MVLVDRLVAFDGYEVTSLGCKVAVHLRCGYLNGFIMGEAGCGFTQCGKHHGEVLVEFLLESVENILFVDVNLVPQGLTLVERQFFNLFADFGNGIFIGLDGSLDVGAHVIDAAAKCVVVEVFHFGAEGLDGFDYRLDLLEVALRLVAEYLA